MVLLVGGVVDLSDFITMGRKSAELAIGKGGSQVLSIRGSST